MRCKYSFLTLATLDDTIQIEMILSVLCRPRWPRQVQSHGTVAAGVIALTFANWRAAKMVLDLFPAERRRRRRWSLLPTSSAASTTTSASSSSSSVPLPETPAWHRWETTIADKSPNSNTFSRGQDELQLPKFGASYEQQQQQRYSNDDRVSIL